VKDRTAEYIRKNFKLDPLHIENMRGLNHVKADISLLVKKYSDILEKLAVPTISKNMFFYIFSFFSQCGIVGELFTM
jgi:hypothetical protein